MIHNPNHDLASNELPHSPSKGVVTEKVTDEGNYSCAEDPKSEHYHATSSVKSDYSNNSVK